jgi:hypothetical protein
MATATEDTTRLSLKDESSDESPIPRTDGFYALQKSVDRSPNGCAITRWIKPLQPAAVVSKPLQYYAAVRSRPHEEW